MIKILIRKDNQIEIWSDGWNKGPTFLVTLLSFFAIMSIITGIYGCLNGDVLKGLIIAIVIPSILIFISIKMFLQEKKSYLMLVVNSNYIDIYSTCKKNTLLEKIPLEQISKINIIRHHSKYYHGLSAEIIYSENNTQKKYSFQIVNKEWLKTAIQEYRKDLLIE